jgi:hypothetical protein
MSQNFCLKHPLSGTHFSLKSLKRLLLCLSINKNPFLKLTISLQDIDDTLILIAVFDSATFATKTINIKHLVAINVAIVAVSQQKYLVSYIHNLYRNKF